MIECKALAKRVREYRFKNNMTQAALAKIAGVLQSQVSQLERQHVAGEETIDRLRAAIQQKG